MASKQEATIMNWLGNGGRLRVARELRTNAGAIFAPGETVRLLRLEPSLVDHSFTAVLESEKDAGKVLRVKETLFDALLPVDY